MDIENEIYEHFNKKMVQTILSLQTGYTSHSNEQNLPASHLAPVNNLNDFGEELITCCKSLTLYQVYTN